MNAQTIINVKIVDNKISDQELLVIVCKDIIVYMILIITNQVQYVKVKN